MGSTMLVDGPVLNFRWVMLDKFFSNFVMTIVFGRGGLIKIMAKGYLIKKEKKKKLRLRQKFKKESF
jgi:hypothetical protein